MKQLGVLDTAFINMEHRNTPQHIGGLGLYDPSTAPGGFVRFKDVIARFEEKLNKLPLFRTRLVQVPGGHDKPYWVKDANFDVEFHLRHIALPHPGDWRQLCILISRIHSRPIDMSRPLWEAYIIEGLDNIEGMPKGCFAVYTKIHHSLLDGAGGASFMSVLHDLEPDPDEREETDEELEQRLEMPDRQPSSLVLRGNALFNRMNNYAGMIRGSVPLAKKLSSSIWGVVKGNTAAPPLFHTPKNRFSQSVGPYRVLEAAMLDLEGFKQIKNITHTKINDVALAVISGGMRKYLEHHDELPEESMITTIPMDMRSRRGDNHENNQLGSAFSSLHSDIADPIERLMAIHHSTDEAKAFTEENPLVDVLQLSGMFSPRLTQKMLNLYADNKLADRLPVNISTVISNVPGPDFPLYSCGAKLVRYHGIGMLTPGVGLFHLIFSYCGTISLTALADRSIMPDPSLYIEFLHEAYNELKTAAQALQTQAEADKKKAKAKTKKSASSSSSSTSKKKSASSSAKLNIVKDQTEDSVKSEAKTEATEKQTEKVAAINSK